MHATKLEITDEEGIREFKEGQEGVRIIKIDMANKLIEIIYEESSEWDISLIPFEKLSYIQIKKTKMNVGATVVGGF